MIWCSASTSSTRHTQTAPDTSALLNLWDLCMATAARRGCHDAAKQDRGEDAEADSAFLVILESRSALGTLSSGWIGWLESPGSRAAIGD